MMPEEALHEDRARKLVTVIVGSPNRGGATYTAAEKFLAALESHGDVRGEIVGLRDYDLGVCRGCKLCTNKGEEYCPLHDDRDIVIGKMLASDGVVFASPNYMFQVTGLMKIFLDRLAFLGHRPRMHGRTFSAIVPFAIYRARPVRRYLEFVGGSVGFKVVRGSTMRTLMPMTEKAVEKMDKTLEKQAARFHRELSKPPFRAPSTFSLVMFRMGRTGIRKSGLTELRDYSYYSERGWFESEYYYPTHLGPVKKAVGGAADWLTLRLPIFKVAQ